MKHLKGGASHELRSYEGIAGLYRRPGSIPPLRRRYHATAIGVSRYASAARTCVQKEGGKESAQAWPKTKAQDFGLGPRVPRHGLVDRFRFISLAGQFHVGQTLADDLTNADIKPLGISHFTIIKSECLLVDIPKQVKRLDADVGTVQTALQEAPEVFHCIGVNVAVYVFNRVVDDGVLIVGTQAVVGLQFIGKDCRASFDVLSDLFLKFPLTAVIYNHRSNVTAAPSFP